jgi:transposase
MEREYVGIDLHRRSTIIYRMAEDGEVLGCERIVSQPFELTQAMAAAGPEAEVVLESTYGWYWAAVVLQDLGARVHLAHALGNNWGNRRVKNDERDAQDLAAMLRLGCLAEGSIAPPEVRELRELVRYR